MNETRVIEVARGDSRKQVEATIYGQLATHPSVMKNGELDNYRSSITHIASGTSLRQYICNETVAGYVERLATFDWDTYVLAGKPAPNVWFGERFSELKAIMIDIDNACDCEEAG